MKKSISFIFLLMINGCASITGYHFEPKNTKEAEKLISYSVDEFENHSWLQSESVINLDHANAVYKFRAFFDRDKQLNYVQVYINLRFTDWYFINDAVMKNEDVSLSKIDRNVVISSSVHENVAVNISTDILNQMSKQDTRIKLKGRRGDYIFTVSKNMSKAFLNQLSLHTQKI